MLHTLCHHTMHGQQETGLIAWLQDPSALKRRPVALGSRCTVCSNMVCCHDTCSVFYSKRFCAPCARANASAFPVQLVKVCVHLALQQFMVTCCWAPFHTYAPHCCCGTSLILCLQTCTTRGVGCGCCCCSPMSQVVTKVFNLQLPAGLQPVQQP